MSGVQTLNSQSFPVSSLFKKNGAKPVANPTAKQALSTNEKRLF